VSGVAHASLECVVEGPLSAPPLAPANQCADTADSEVSYSPAHLPAQREFAIDLQARRPLTARIEPLVLLATVPREARKGGVVTALGTRRAALRTRQP
jgi:hypothetical protein